jgi:hypothetical protein
MIIRGLFLVMFLSSVLAVISSAQTPPLQSCPRVLVTGPAGIVDPGEMFRFYVSVEPEDSSRSVTFEWEVKGGTIVSRRDGNSIDVRPEKYYNKTITATVKVIGLSEGCANIASEDAESICDPYLVIGDAALWAQYSGEAWLEERKNLDSLVDRGLKRYPNYVIYLEKSFSQEMRQQDVNTRIGQIRKYLSKVRKLPKDRFFIRLSIGNRNQTTGYLVPQNAPVLDPNYSDPCLK